MKLNGIVGLTGILFLTAGAEDFQGSTHELAYEDELIQYSKRTPHTAVEILQDKIDQGKILLSYDPKSGYLPALLAALEIPRSSQMLVFSKTSLQRRLISPRHPRALFFNDQAYVGYIPGAPKLEVTAMDPDWGPMFYKLEQDETQKPQFTREAECMQCHGSGKNLGVPGLLVRSVLTNSEGEPAGTDEVAPVNHCTPIADRWGGWYVTGKHGAQLHRGNLVDDKARAQQKTKPNSLGNLTDLSRFFAIKEYLQPTSDIVALMLLEHQSHMHNYITRLNYETQTMMAMYHHIRYLGEQENAFLRYLFMTEEVPLTAPIEGNPEFVKDFALPALRDPLGRSLRDLDLKTRLLRYPCSYLIYDPSFDRIPEPMRTHLYQRIHDILTGKDQNPMFAHLTPTDRKNILEILLETKNNLPDFWKTPPSL